MRTSSADLSMKHSTSPFATTLVKRKGLPRMMAISPTNSASFASPITRAPLPSSSNTMDTAPLLMYHACVAFSPLWCRYSPLVKDLDSSSDSSSGRSSSPRDSSISRRRLSESDIFLRCTCFSSAIFFRWSLTSGSLSRISPIRSLWMTSTSMSVWATSDAVRVAPSSMSATSPTTSPAQCTDKSARSERERFANFLVPDSYPFTSIRVMTSPLSMKYASSASSPCLVRYSPSSTVFLGSSE
mmetsp:Transcript_33037/g.105252  ORF Transcript_33037/g.105252 Transcript_33037/m.105252 type:complete len:242 (-) Transcript_33037:1119-1844(-)